MRTKETLDGQKRPCFIEAVQRAQIIESAIETIATLAYAQTSLAQIAKRAGISKGVIVSSFPSKEELLRHVITQIYTAAVYAVAPQIAAQPPVILMVQVSISATVESRADTETPFF